MLEANLPMWNLCHLLCSLWDYVVYNWNHYFGLGPILKPKIDDIFGPIPYRSKTDTGPCTVAVYSWSIANNFVIGVHCRYLETLSQIAFSSVANYFRSYRKKQFGIESVGIYSRHQ